MNWGVTALLFEGERADEQMIRFAIARGARAGLHPARRRGRRHGRGLPRGRQHQPDPRGHGRGLSRPRARQGAMDDVRLTSLVPAGGCARKLPAEDLASLLACVAPFPHAWVDPEVGPMEDAAIVRPESGASARLHGRLHHARGRRAGELRRDRRGERPLGRVCDGGRAAGRAGGLRRAAERTSAGRDGADLPRRARQGGRGRLRDRGRAHDRRSRAQVRARGAGLAGGRALARPSPCAAPATAWC